MRVKIVTKMDWPAFTNVALQTKKALSNYCDCAIYDRTNIRPGGNILFIGTVFHQTLNSLSPFLGRSRVVFYGTTEGHSFVERQASELQSRLRL